jgi:CBS domain-containing protein
MHLDPTGGSVREVMTDQAITVIGDMPLSDAADLLDRFAISALPVVDRAGRVVGIVTESDLLRVRASVSLWARWPVLTAADIMTTPVITARADEPIADAARQMDARHIHRLVIVDDELRALGIVSAGDVVRAMAGRVDH